MPAGRPPKYETPEQMQEVIDLYFLACKLNKLEDLDLITSEKEKLTEDEKQIVDYVECVIPTVSGLAYILGMSTEALRNYECKPEFLATVKKAKQRVEISIEQRLAGNAVAGSIFNLKNNFGWKDKVETEHTGEMKVTLTPNDQSVL